MTASISCIFCSIINKKIPATIIDENEHTIVIKDINPKAPIHYLIIPKIHRQSLLTMQNNDLYLATEIMAMAHQLAQNLPAPQAFRLIMNNGKEVGQSVFHMHMHFVAGKQLSDF